MKTPAEWMELAFEDGPVLEEFIAAIQQDARHQGYTEAAEIMGKQPCQDDNGESYEEYCRLKKAILAARDNLTTP